MALSLLERVKNKALEALQGAGNFVGNEIQQLPSQIQGFGDILSHLAQNQIQQQTKAIQNPLETPAIPLFGDKSPTQGDVLKTIADFTYRPIARIGAEGVQTLTGDNREYDPAKDFKNPTIAKILYGDKPLQNWNDPNRPGRQFAKGIGHPELAVPLMVAGAAVDLLPVNPAKLLEKGGIKAVAKESKTLEEFAKVIGENKNILQEVNGIIKDTKNPLNSVEEIYAKYGPQATKKTADLIKEAKNVGPKVDEVVKTIGDNGEVISKQAGNIPPEINPFEPGNIYKKKGTFKKLFEDFARSSKGVIGRAGPAGQEIVRRLDAAEHEAATLGGEATAKMQTVLKALTPDEIATFSDVAEGIKKPISQAQADAVKVWHGIAGDVFSRAKELGLDIGKVENYFPHQILELSNADKRLIAQEMVSSGKYKTEAEALSALEKEVSGEMGRQAERRFGNLELSRRTDLPYNKSPNVLFDYINNAYGRLADVKNFGKSDEELYKLARAAGTQGGDTNQVMKYLDQILGKNQSPNKLTQNLTSLQTITKLNPVTSAVNLTQNLSTWLRTDTGTMFKTLGGIVRNPAKAFENATKVGEISPSMAKELQDYVGTGKAASKWIRLIGMQGTEKFNRVMAVNAGINYGEKLAKQAIQGSGAAIRELERFGIGLKDITEDGKLTDNALKAIGRQVSGETQFSTKAGELPYFWRTNIGKVVTQFKSFAYKQTGFIANEGKRVVSETAKGNPKPLINALMVYGIAAPLAGEIVNDFRALIRNKSREDTDSLAERYVSNILAATSFGLLDSTGGLLGEYGLGGVINTLGGPSVGDAQKLFQAGSDAVEGVSNGDGVDPYLRTTRNLIKEIPAVGQTIANTVVPNGFVDNLNIPGTDINLGVNTGEKLNEPDSQGGLLGSVEKLFGGGKQTGDTLKWKDDNGKTVTVNLNQKDYSGKEGIAAYKQDTSNASKAVQIWGAPTDQISDEEKIAAYKKLGFEPDDVRYAYKAGFTNDEKTAYIMDKNLPHDELIKSLATGRVESIKGDYFASNGVLDNLYEEGLISKAERAYLKKIKITKDGKLATSSLQGTGLSASKIKSFLNSLNSLYKDPIETASDVSKTKIKGSVPTTKPIAPPKLDLSTKGGQKTAAKWFTAY